MQSRRPLNLKVVGTPTSIVTIKKTSEEDRNENKSGASHRVWSSHIAIYGGEMMKRVMNSRTGTAIVDHLEVAQSFKTRLVGLIGRTSLPWGHGLLLRKSGNSIHTCFMRFRIDALFINKSGTIKYLAENIKPWRVIVAPCFESTDCLEVPAGTIKATGTITGDKVSVEI